MIFKTFPLIIALTLLNMLNAVEGHKPAVDGAELGKWTQDHDAALELAST